MKIAHITPSFYPAFVYGGTTESVFRLCRSVAQGGAEVRVLTTDANGPRAVLDVPTDREQALDNIRVRYCRRLRPESVSIELLRQIEDYVRWADVVHLTAVYSFPTWPTFLTCRRWNKPLVWSPRGALQRWAGSRRVFGKRVWDGVCRRIAPQKLFIHATSDDEASVAKQRFPRAVVRTIANGIDWVSDDQPREKAARTRLLYLGRLDPKKGIENLLEAYALLHKDSRPRSLVIAGAGEAVYENRLREKIRSLGLQDAVEMPGMLSGAAKERLFQTADIVIAPSYTENFCIVVAEALARGVPVIASQGTPWKRVEEVGCGLWVANDPTGLAQAVRRMESLPLTEMGIRGKTWMRNEFTWDAVATQMLDFYRQTVTR